MIATKPPRIFLANGGIQTPDVTTQAIGSVRNILCPVDFSPGSVAAWGHALAFAQASQGLVTLLHVIDEHDAVNEPAIRGGRPRFLQVAEARARLGMAVTSELLRSCLVRLAVESGPIAPVTLDVAERHAIDLIVLGVDAAAPVNLLREAVIAQAPCPVLVVLAPTGYPDWDAEFDVPGGRHQGAPPYSLAASL
jgi:nucleotide-binding universal stress UspA family protein